MMLNLLRVESYKMRKNKVFWVLTNLIVAVACISVILFFLEEKGVIKAVEDEGFTLMEIQTEEMVFIPLSGIAFFMDNTPEWTITILLISVLGAFMISTENSSGTIKNLASIGYGRPQIYLAKLTVFLIGTILLHLLISVAFGFFGTVFFGIGEIPPIEEIVHMGKIGLLSSVYLLAFSAITMFFAMIVRGSGMAILVSLTCYFAFGPFLMSLGRQYVFFEHINHYSVYYRYMTIVASDLNQVSVLVELIAIPAITAIVFIGLGIIMFQRKDIQ